jgi:hypothetical protein
MKRPRGTHKLLEVKMPQTKKKRKDTVKVDSAFNALNSD